MDGWKEWKDVLMFRKMDGEMYGWKDGMMIDGWMEIWMIERWMMERCINVRKMDGHGWID